MVIYLIITFQNQENFICISKTCTVRFFGDRYNKKSINIAYAALAVYVSFMFKCNLHLRLSVLKSKAALFLNRKRISASQSEKLMNSIDPFQRHKRCCVCTTGMLLLQKRVLAAAAVLDSCTLQSIMVSPNSSRDNRFRPN